MQTHQDTSKSVPVNGLTGMALVFHELATNAAKYGALHEAAGTIRIDWRIQNGVLTLRWVETGMQSPASEPRHIGFGSKLVRRTVEGQFGGTITHDWNVNGLIVTLEAPLSRIQSDVGG